MNQKPYYIAIAAISENRAIGKDGKIPWYIPEDFRHFKETTLGSPIIMGRKTYESIGRPLPGRENIVISRGGTSYEWTTSVTSVDELDTYLSSKWVEKAYICGGGEIYRLFFDLGKTNEVILSRVKMDVPDADAYFPEFESDFTLVQTDEREDFIIQYWNKKHEK